MKKARTYTNRHSSEATTNTNLPVTLPYENIAGSITVGSMDLASLLEGNKEHIQADSKGANKSEEIVQDCP